MSYIPFPPLSPEIFSVDLFGMTFALRWYALAYIVGIIIGWRIAVAAVKRADLWADSPPMTPDQVERLLTWVIVGVIVGGRLGFVLFYQPGYYFDNPSHILRIWEGGMAFHGGFLGVIVAAYAFCRSEDIPIGKTADLMALSTAPGLLLGRIANFINAELWGRPTTLPWGVAFPGEAAQTCPGVIGICARHPSQLYEALLEGAILGGLLLWLAWRKGWLRQTGRIAGLFFAGYATARFLVEFFRQPDAQFVGPGNPLGLAVQIGGYGLTMGQLLSVPMFVVGIILILRARRQT